MAVDGLAPCVTRSSAAMELTMKDIYIYNCWKKSNLKSYVRPWFHHKLIDCGVFLWLIVVCFYGFYDWLWRVFMVFNVILLLFVNHLKDFLWFTDCLTIGIIHETMVVHMTWDWTFFNNYSNHPRKCVLSTLCGNVDKHSPFDIYIYIYIYISFSSTRNYFNNLFQLNTEK